MVYPGLFGNDLLVSKAMASWWANFAVSLNPNGQDAMGKALPSWKAFGDKEDYIMSINLSEGDNKIETVTGLKAKSCKIIDPVIRRLVQGG